MNTNLTAKIYSTSGKETGTIELPASVFAVPRNDSLVQQIVLGMQANARTPVASTKGRGEVRGGGRKPWKQKGTGRARHGSIRSPLWRGGGTTHGPLKERTYEQKLNKKMRAKALAIALSAKLQDGKILFVESLTMKEPKTKEARAALAGLSKVAGFDTLQSRRKNAALILTGNNHAAVSKSFRNMGNVFVNEARNANPVDVLSYRFIVMVEPEKGVKALASRMEK